MCLSCNGWKPPGVEVLPSDPNKPEETYVLVVQRKVPGKDQRPTSNVKWFCMGCGNEYTSRECDDASPGGAAVVAG